MAEDAGRIAELNAEDLGLRAQVQALPAKVIELGGWLDALEELLAAVLGRHR